MATVTVNVTRVEKINLNNPNIVEIHAEYGNFSITRTLDLRDFTNMTDFANWLINQDADRETVPNFEKQLVITFHQNNGSRLVDGVVVNPLP